MSFANEQDPRTGAIIGAAMEVHRLLGPGFLEGVYQEALALELGLRGIPFKREVHFPVVYKGQSLKLPYRADLVCFDGIIVELKALPRMGALEESQILNYLKASGLPIGLLLNFGSKSLEFKRFAGPSANAEMKSVESVKSVDSIPSLQSVESVD